jgi:hypothetical protein
MQTYMLSLLLPGEVTLAVTPLCNALGDGSLQLSIQAIALNLGVDVGLINSAFVAAAAKAEPLSLQAPVSNLNRRLQLRQRYGSASCFWTQTWTRD